MNGIVEIRKNVYWIGAKDPELRVFDDLFPTKYGTTYNSFLIRGEEKTAIIDTVKGNRAEEFLAKVRELVDPATVDYYVVNHTEPDHSGSLEFMLERSPKAEVVSTQAAKTFLSNLIHKPLPSRVIKDGERIDLGGRTLRFIVAPFLHWPDTMFTMLEEEGTLFTCDAFGSHFCGDGLYDDEAGDFSDETRFYFDCIMRPFKDKALSAIEKIRNERIDLLCPSHGPILRSDPWKYVSMYEQWCTRPQGPPKVVIFYLSPHGNTARMAEAVERGAASVPGTVVEKIHITEVSPAKIRDLMEEGDALVFGVPTINRDIPKPMWDVLSYLSTVSLKTNIAGIFGSYGWSGEACRFAEERLKGLGFKLPVPFLRNQFAPLETTLEECEKIGRGIAEAIAARGAR